MQKTQAIRSPVDLRSLDRDKDKDISHDIFCKREESETLLISNKLYPSAIVGLMFLASQACPYIAFVVNLLAKHIS